MTFLIFDNINGGYVSLAVVALVFFALQFWWITMTIRNGSNERAIMNQDNMQEIKNRLEKLFSKSD